MPAELSKQRESIRKMSKATRRWRRIHYYTGITVALLLLISAVTGLLLGWKKDVDALQPPTMEGKAKDLSEWIALSEIEHHATRAMQETVGADYTLERMDIRPDKGIAKVLFTPGYWEVQVDGASGEVLSVQKRYSDLIEKIHDGSILGDGVKLVSMNILGVTVIIIILTGFWLWYAPKKIRNLKS